MLIQPRVKLCQLLRPQAVNSALDVLYRIHWPEAPFFSSTVPDKRGCHEFQGRGDGRFLNKDGHEARHMRRKLSRSIFVRFPTLLLPHPESNQALCHLGITDFPHHPSKCRRENPKTNRRLPSQRSQIQRSSYRPRQTQFIEECRQTRIARRSRPTGNGEQGIVLRMVERTNGRTPARHPHRAYARENHLLRPMAPRPHLEPSKKPIRPRHRLPTRNPAPGRASIPTKPRHHSHPRTPLTLRSSTGPRNLPSPPPPNPPPIPPPIPTGACGARCQPAAVCHSANSKNAPHQRTPHHNRQAGPRCSAGCQPAADCQSAHSKRAHCQTNPTTC